MKSVTRRATVLLLFISFLLPLVSLQAGNLCSIYDDNFKCDNGSPRSSFWIREDPPPDCGSNLVNTTLTLFAEGDKVIEEQFKKFGTRTEAVLMIGKTGTGKSTLTYFLAGNNSAMISIDDHMGGKRITDCNGKIGGSLIVSETTFPELVIDPQTSTSFFDYPGFFDTRAACVEIANAYFMLSVARKIPKVKIMIVVDHPAVNGAVKGSIKQTLESVINFIPNIESYAGGIGLIATKVNLPSNDDTAVQGFIQYYLGTVRNEINGTLTGEKLRKAIFIIDQWLLPGRIGPFRTPDDCGPLSDLPYMQSNKASLTKTIGNLNYVTTKPNDFNMSLSGDAQIELANLASSLASDVTTSLQKFKTIIVQGISTQTSCPSLAECTRMLSSVTSLYNNDVYIRGYEDAKFWKDYTFRDMIGNATALFPTLFPEIVVDAALLQLLQLNTGYLDFIQSLNASSVDVSQWIAPLKELKGEASKILETKLKSVVNTGIKSTIDSLFEELYNFLIIPFATLGDINNQLGQVILLSNKLKSIIDTTSSSLSLGIRLSQFVSTTIANCQSLGLSPTNTIILLLKHEVDFVNFLEGNMGLGNIGGTEKDFWLKSYTEFQVLIQREQDWCNFAITLFNDLADKKYQVDKQDLKTWWSGIKPFEYTNTSKEDLTSFYEKFSSLGGRPLKEQSELTNILSRDTVAKVKTLDLLLATSLDNSLTCSGAGTDRTVCEGKFVSLKDVLKSTSRTVTKSIVIKSMHSVYIDDELNGGNWNDGSNLNVVILSPTWITVNNISLNGRTGLTVPAFESKGSSEGAPGGVGYNGGNFYGIGQIFPESYPQVQVNGGTGGNGQKGQDGNIGTDGEVVEVLYDSSDKINETYCNSWAGGKVLLLAYNPHTCTPEHKDGGGACQANDDGAQFLVEGTNGMAGQNGGAGGKAGLGGLGGNVFLKLVTTAESKDSPGDVGIQGSIANGGIGGDGGKKGDTFEIWIDDAKGATGKWCKHRKHSIVLNSNRAKPGNNGGNGQSSKPPGGQIPTVPEFKPVDEATKYKAEFTTAATTLQNSNKFFKTPLKGFVDKMNSMTA